MAKAIIRQGKTGSVTADWDNDSISYDQLYGLCQKLKNEAMRVAELQGENKTLKSELAQERYRSAQLAAELNRRNVADNSNATVAMKLRAAEELMRQDNRRVKNIKVGKNELD